MGCFYVEAFARCAVKARQILLAGGIFGGLGVAIGAFGAHWLKDAVIEWGLSTTDQVKRLENWEVGVRYQMYHAFALLIAGLLAARGASRKAVGWSATLFVVGTSIFSGCLYAYVLSGNKVFGAIVPIGGTALIAGWIMLSKAAWSVPSDPQ